MEIELIPSGSSLPHDYGVIMLKQSTLLPCVPPKIFSSILQTVRLACGIGRIKGCSVLLLALI